MTGHFDAAPRALHAGDAEAARSLVFGTLGVTPYVDRVMELLSSAMAGDPETRGLVTERDGTAAALALFGPVAGAQDTWRIDVVLVTPGLAGEVGRALVDAVLESVRGAGGRLLMAELPADAVVGRALTLLRSCGFRQEGHVADYYRDGVALLLLRMKL